MIPQPNMVQGTRGPPWAQNNSHQNQQQQQIYNQNQQQNRPANKLSNEQECVQFLRGGVLNPNNNYVQERNIHSNYQPVFSLPPPVYANQTANMAYQQATQQAQQSQFFPPQHNLRYMPAPQPIQNQRFSAQQIIIHERLGLAPESMHNIPQRADLGLAQQTIYNPVNPSTNNFVVADQNLQGPSIPLMLDQNHWQAIHNQPLSTYIVSNDQPYLNYETQYHTPIEPQTTEFILQHGLQMQFNQKFEEQIIEAPKPEKAMEPQGVNKLSKNISFHISNTPNIEQRSPNSNCKPHQNNASPLQQSLLAPLTFENQPMLNRNSVNEPHQSNIVNTNLEIGGFEKASSKGSSDEKQDIQKFRDTNPVTSSQGMFDQGAQVIQNTSSQIDYKQSIFKRATSGIAKVLYRSRQNNQDSKQLQKPSIKIKNTNQQPVGSNQKTSNILNNSIYNNYSNMNLKIHDNYQDVSFKPKQINEDFTIKSCGIGTLQESSQIHELQVLPQFAIKEDHFNEPEHSNQIIQPALSQTQIQKSDDLQSEDLKKNKNPNLLTDIFLQNPQIHQFDNVQSFRTTGSLTLYKVEIFIDLMCAKSGHLFKILKEFLDKDLKLLEDQPSEKYRDLVTMQIIPFAFPFYSFSFEVVSLIPFLIELGEKFPQVRNKIVLKYIDICYTDLTPIIDDLNNNQQKFSQTWSEIVSNKIGTFLSQQGVPPSEFNSEKIIEIFSQKESDNHILERAKDTWKYGASLGIHQSPTLLVNGQKMIEYPENIEKLEKLMNTLIIQQLNYQQQ